MNDSLINTLQGWNDFNKRIKDKCLPVTSNEFEVDITVSCDESNESSNVLNLQSMIYSYYFLTEIKKIKCKFNIRIIEGEGDSEIHKKQAQIQQLFRIFNDNNENFHLTINGNEMKLNDYRVGRFQPIITVDNDENSKFCHRTLLEDGSDLGKTLGLIKEVIGKYIATSDFKAIDGEDMNRLLADSMTSQVFKEKVEKIRNGTYPENGVPFHNLYTFEKTDDIKTITKKIILMNCTGMLSNLNSSKLNPSVKERRSSFFNMIMDYVIEKLKSVSLLTLHIFSSIVRYLIESKEFSIGAHDDKKRDFGTRALLENTMMDAMSYADGLYQILENSCIHSQRHRAFYCFRVYNTKLLSSKGELENVANTIRKLNKQYHDKLSFRADRYFEINCFDLTLGNNGRHVGMLETYNGNQDENQDENLKTIKDLFFIEPKDENDIIHHYGLRTLNKIVLLNDGCMLLKTFGDEEQKCEENISFVKNEKGVLQGWKKYDVTNIIYGMTNYNIIFPIYNSLKNQRIEPSMKGNGIFELDEIENDVYAAQVKIDSSVLIDGKKEINSSSSIETKKSVVNNIYTELNAVTNNSEKDNNNLKVLLIDFDLNNYFCIEILAKAIMKYVLGRKEKKNRIAILFSDRNHISSFIRVYSCFFDKITSNNSNRFIIENTQIALCSVRNDIPEVNFVLSGNDLKTARHSARAYLYYNTEATMEFIPLVKYLINLENSNENEKFLPTFPFDLYLECPSAGQNPNNWQLNPKSENTWFSKRVKRMLETSIQESGQGCKIDNVHVSIGSKIHIDTFYNAKMLFHNYGNICRFAYIVAQDLLAEHRTGGNDKNILLLSYGNNTQLLVSEVSRIINEEYKNKKLKCEKIIFSSHFDEDDSIKRGGLWREFRRFVENEGESLSNYFLYIIFPVATTLTTVYKVRNIAQRVCRSCGKNEKELNFKVNYALVLVGGVEGNVGIEMKYWKDIKENRKLIELACGADKDNESIVKYFFNTKSKWHDPNDKACDDKNCLISVDKNQDFTNAVFEKFNAKKPEFKKCNFEKCNIEKCNIEKCNIEECNIEECNIEAYYGCISYSHISDANNHYQYSIDLKRFYENNEAKVDKWLEKTVREKINANAFNIIVSPLYDPASGFLKSVIDNAFESCTRLFNVYINTSLKEDIRSKFSYISEEYERAKNILLDPVINVYYVDTCIVTGNTFCRSRQFMQMLLSEFGTKTKASIFKGIILLCNRSSYETIENLLCGESIENFSAYSNLNVPSYNTVNGICPSCELDSDYDLMHKRSSTPAIANEFRRLTEKHRPKDLSEYDYWLNERISKSAYNHWVAQWLYYQRELLKTGTCIIATGDTVSLDEMQAFVNLFTESNVNVLERLKNLTSDEMEMLKKLVKKYILNDRDYMRLSCTHNIFSKVSNCINGADSMEKAISKTREKILSVIEADFKRIDNCCKENKTTKQLSDWLKAECLLSYIKVTSRKQIAKYYHIRCAIYGILYDLSEGLIRNDKTKVDLKQILELCSVNSSDRSDEGVMPELKWRILLGAIRRLSAMHSSFVLNNAEDIVNFYRTCKKQFDAAGEFKDFYTTAAEKEYKRYIGFFDDKTIAFEIARLIKWAAMSNYDESKCFKIKESAKKYIKDYSDKEDQCLVEIWKTSFLENVQIIYNGLNRLDECDPYNCANDSQKAKQYIINAIKNATESSEGGITTYYKMNPHSKFFEFMDDEHLHNLNGTDNIVSEKFGYMLSFFHLMKRLSFGNVIVNNPYEYEKVCNLMARIVDCTQCKIICGNDYENHVIAGSSIDKDYFINDLSMDDFENVISLFRKNETSAPVLVNKTVQKFHYKKNKIIVLSIPIENDENPMLYIVLYKKEESSKDSTKIESDDLEYKELWDVRNILFLRDKLEKSLYRDIIVLKDMIHRYNYIEKINKKPFIMHISDLHINAASNSEGLLKSLKDSSKAPDLLLITGDIVRGAYTAKELVENYNAAERFIRNLSLELWGEKNTVYGEEKTFVRYDWKKRIVISVGNHDYASMNELAAKNKRRATLSGTPVGNMGTTMIKHSYLINSLHSLLGVEIDDCVKYGLNQVINYCRMGLSVVNINTNSHVNPYRTNKVRMNTDYINDVIKKVNQEHIVFMMHHTPLYDIDYVDDMFYLSVELDSKDKETIYNVFPPEKRGDMIPSNALVAFIKHLADEPESKVFNCSNVDFENAFKCLLSVIKDKKKEKYLENNLEDFDYYLDTPKEERCYDDRCQKIVNNIKGQIAASETDNDEYCKCAREMFEKIENEYIIIGGHTHVARVYNGQFIGALKNCTYIAESSLYLKGNKLNYETISYEEKDPDSGAPVHTFIGETPRQIESSKAIKELLKPQESMPSE